jgi:predicted nucleic acid-binding protein
MNDKIFLDTNILVYAYNSDDPTKQKITVKLLRENFAEKEIYISVQVLNEFYAVLSKHKIEHSEIEQYINEITNSVQILPINVLISKKALDIRRTYRYSWWDSLVLASALKSNSSILYSEDMQHGQIIESSLKIINPFAG